MALRVCVVIGHFSNYLGVALWLSFGGKCVIVVGRDGLVIFVLDVGSVIKILPVRVLARDRTAKGD